MKIHIKQQRGVILATILIFIVLLSLLSIHALQNSLLQAKMSHNFYQNAQLLNLAETVLEAAELQAANRSIKCKTEDDLEANYVSNNAQTWWQANACKYALNGHTAYYFVQQYSFDACAGLTNSKQLGVIYYRVSVWAANEQHPVLLQSTYAIAAKADNHKTQGDCIHRQITAGRQSWRQLY